METQIYGLEAEAYYIDECLSYPPVHGEGGWELAKYEWRDGRGRFLYVRETGETQEVWRDQPQKIPQTIIAAWCDQLVAAERATAQRKAVTQ